MNNIVVLISGRGSNLAAVLKVAADEKWDTALGARVAAVISNRAGAEGLAIAAAYGVPGKVIEHRAFPSREEFDKALAAEIDRHAPKLVLLAGFMRVLTGEFVRRYEGRLINIHPSLLPLFPGLKTHRQALDAGVRVHGATVHFVSDRVDGGAIIAQTAVPVLPGDDEAALAQRVLVQEHRLLPRAVRAVLEGGVRYVDGRAVLGKTCAGDLSMLAA